MERTFQLFEETIDYLHYGYHSEVAEIAVTVLKMIRATIKNKSELKNSKICFTYDAERHRPFDKDIRIVALKTVKDKQTFYRYEIDYDKDILSIIDRINDGLNSYGLMAIGTDANTFYIVKNNVWVKV